MIIFGIVVLIFFLDRWVKYSLYPFDSLRSLRVTVVGRAFRAEPITMEAGCFRYKNPTWSPGVERV